MDGVAEELALYLVNRFQSVSPNSCLLVGLAGIPASGKSTLAQLVVPKLNQRLDAHQPPNEDPGASPKAILIGLDGWHLTRSQLDALPDPKLAHDRRGAHWTFDGPGYVEFVKKLRKPLPRSSDEQSTIILAPSFDHSAKDPVTGDISVHPFHRIVLIEGLYTFLSTEPWKEAGELLDERWFIDVGVDVASDRLVKRHVATGVAKDMAEATWRSDENDMPNGRFITTNMLEPTRRIPSLHDPTFAATN